MSASGYNKDMPIHEAATAPATEAPNTEKTDLGAQRLQQLGLEPEQFGEVLVFDHKEGEWQTLTDAARVCIYAAMDVKSKVDLMRAQGLEGDELRDEVQKRTRQEGEQVAGLFTSESGKPTQTFHDALRERGAKKNSTME